MRKIYLLFTLFAVLVTQSLLAQTVTIPTANTNSGNLNDPLGTFFGYERTALIYTPTEVASPGIISSVGFYLNSVSTPGAAVDVRVYIKQRADLFTAATTYTTETTGATLVYGPTTIPAASFIGGQWITIPLATNFTYNGTSNLEVIVETNATGGGNEGGTGKQFRVALQPGNNYYQRWQQDNTAPTGTGTLGTGRPNIQLTFSNPPCVSGSLAGGTAQSSVAAACAGVGFDLTVAPGSASFGSAITYQWESSPTGGAPWTSVGGATGLSANVTQTAATYYRRKMTCSGIDAFSTSIQVTQNSFTNCYCNAGLTNTINGIDIVTNVLLTNSAGGNYANASTSNATTNYVSYNNTPLDLSQQTTNSLAITFGTDGTQFSAAWIDYNQNGVFESTENIALAAASSGGGTTVTYNFVVPASALLGNTRIRVRGGSDGAYTLGGACTATSFGETEDYLVNITPPPPCVAPTNIGVSALSPTTATLNWTAPTPGPASGYEWEVRTSGAGGSGATGLVTSGTTAAGIITANAAGLTPNTTYNLYVRSACTAGTLYSVWTGPVAFKTPCTFITAFPFTETFEAASPSRSCWTTSLTGGTDDWTYEAGAGNGGSITAAHGGTLNATHYGSGDGTVAKLISPAFDFSTLNPALGAQLSFWYANEDFFGDLNELRVYYKTSAAGPWTLIPGAEYTNNVAVWTQIELLLPSSTTGEYYIAFEGTELFGFGVVVDDVVVSAAPSCPKPTLVRALGISTSVIDVSFTSPGNNFIVEYGAVGFTPGTGAAAGTGGTIVTGTASPISITGLPVNTAYDVYLRRVCVAGVDYSANVLSKASTLCAPVNVPYVQDFNGVTLPNIPTCTSLQDLNESPTWQTITPPATFGFNGTVLRYEYDPSKGADDWFYIQGLNLTGGVAYELDYKYGATDVLYPERMKVAYGTTATASAMTTILKDYPSIVANPAAPYAKLERLVFTPATTGVYYIGFHAYSLPDEFRLYLDSINVRRYSLVDVGVTAASSLPVCPGNTILQATVSNYNLAPVNFAANPVTVTATITGAAATTITTTINTGTLAPGASVVVPLPAYNFIAGNYNMTLATGSADDLETANNSITRAFLVNATPVAAIITPSSAQLCTNGIAQLSTQFTGTGNPKVTWSPITGLYVNALANMIYTAGTDAYTVWAKPTTTTTYTVTTTNVATGCTNTSTVTVTVNSNTGVNITALPARICANDATFALTATPAGGVWTGVGVSGNNFVPAIVTPGSFTLTYTYTNGFGCTTSGTTIAKVDPCPERIRLLRDNAVVLYPNPNQGKFSILINSVLYSNLTMKVYSESGNLVRTQQLSGLTYGRVVPFDLTNLPAGSYMVQFSYDGGVRSSEKTFKVLIGR